jgi:hypothetical protein
MEIGVKQKNSTDILERKYSFLGEINSLPLSSQGLCKKVVYKPYDNELTTVNIR